jgi:glucokinase-like ROK family protein
MQKQSVKKDVLQSGVLKQLYFNKAQSCAELSERLDRSIPSVSRALNELIKKGLAITQGYATSGGGRRPMIYTLPAGNRFIVAVAMDQLATRIAIVDLLNSYVAGPKTLELPLLHNDNALDILIEHINTFIAASGVDRKAIIGVGVGTPGFVNHKEGINYSYLGLGEKNLRDYLQEHIGLPVWVDNDSSLIALAELRFGIGRSKQNVMVVNLGWGIGLGMILNGTIFRGHNGYAGEFSHIPITENGELCTCGKRGCLETEASLLIVAEKAIAEIKRGRVSSLQNVPQDDPVLMGDAVMAAAGRGDQFAIELLSDMGFKIGKAIAILIHLIDPEMIVLSGRGARVGKIFMAPIQHALNKYCIPRLSANTEFRVSQLGFESELIGAAALVMENLGKSQTEILNPMKTRNTTDQAVI